MGSATTHQNQKELGKHLVERTTTMDLNKLYQILDETTTTFRKGPIVQERSVGHVSVTTIDNFPTVPEDIPGLLKVDCHFVTVGVNQELAEKHREEIKTILSGYPDLKRLSKGPSYIEVGGVIGDQGAAFRLFALGVALGFWNIITPKSLKIEGPFADAMAGMGFVMISGYTPERN